MKDEKKISNSVDPVNIVCTEKILDQMKNCICKIKINGVFGTGFFCAIPLGNKETIKVLMTNYHVLNENDMEEINKLNLLLNDEKEILSIDLGIERKIYLNKDYDVTMIELKEEDKIKNYLELDDNLLKDNMEIIYESKSIYVLQYPNGKNACVSYGLLNNIDKCNIMHKCSTDNGSSGSPILNLESNKIIGIHKQGSINFNFNIGTLLKLPINDFIQKNKDNKLLYLNKKIKNSDIYEKKEKSINENDTIIDNKIDSKNDEIIEKHENIIIGEIYIKSNDINKDIRIINSFENVKRENNWKDNKDDSKYANEKEIKENTYIKINGKLIPFTYYYKFEKEGKYNIEYSFKNNLKKANHMFYSCNSFINLNLLNFNAQNVTNMRRMFNGCSSLINLDLSNINTQKVSDMYAMFSCCNSLKNLYLTNINTQNVTNMSYMFLNCKSIINLNLSSFDTKNVNEMKEMFSGCISIINLELSNFNTQNVTDMNMMFENCNSLKSINLSNFNTQKVIKMNDMFLGCKSLMYLDLSNFNTQNVIDMTGMFDNCKLLFKLNLSNFNTQKVKYMGRMFKDCNLLKKHDLITKNNDILKVFDS